ncbi:hypothetical protein RRG08_008514 [Elysia crispata]|uniref:Uncharacterized protein n=1 Tax=Elysia crispata TaxID=231223 RepID=A0AAE0ZA06_9GAST|nr:hypothetical protein RRG08_008514 [Elysia crispata]
MRGAMLWFYQSSVGSARSESSVAGVSYRYEMKKLMDARPVPPHRQPQTQSSILSQPECTSCVKLSS